MLQSQNSLFELHFTLEPKEVAQNNELLWYLTDTTENWTSAPDSIVTRSLSGIHFEVIQARKFACYTMGRPSLTRRGSYASTNRKNHGATFFR